MSTRVPEYIYSNTCTSTILPMVLRLYKYSNTSPLLYRSFGTWCGGTPPSRCCRPTRSQRKGRDRSPARVLSAQGSATKVIAPHMCARRQAQRIAPTKKNQAVHAAVKRDLHIMQSAKVAPTKSRMATSRACVLHLKLSSGVVRQLSLWPMG